MVSWGRAEREAGRALQSLDADELRDQLDGIRSYLKDLSHNFSKTAHRELGRARDFASETAHDAEDTMKEHLAASMLVALGVGVLVGYLIRRETE